MNRWMKMALWIAALMMFFVGSAMAFTDTDGNEYIINADGASQGLLTATLDVWKAAVPQALVLDTVTDVATNGETYTITQLAGNPFNSCKDDLRAVKMSHVKELKGTQFSRAVNLTKAEFPAVTEVEYDAFVGCTSLNDIDFPELTTIGANAFENCSALDAIVFPKAIAIGKGAFSGCTSLTSASFKLLPLIEEDAFKGCKLLSTIDFPAATEIKGSAFQDCTSLTSVRFPLVTTVGMNAFSGCTGLKTVDFPALPTVEANRFNILSLTTAKFEGATLIEGWAFSGCKNLASIHFPKVDEIKQDAFDDCIALIDVAFPEVTTIEVGVFGGCTNLESVSFPKLLAVPNNAFAYLTKLLSARFDSATTMAYNPFSGCTKLQSLYIPNLTAIQDLGLAGLTGLRDLTIASNCAVGSDVFQSWNQPLTLHLEGTQMPAPGSFASDMFDGGIITSVTIYARNAAIYEAWRTALNVTATFVNSTPAPAPPRYVVELSADPEEGGTLSARSVSAEMGQEVTVSVTAAEGYRFVGWFEGDVSVSTKLTYRFSVSGHRALVARFVEGAAPVPKKLTAVVGFSYPLFDPKLTLDYAHAPTDCFTIAGGILTAVAPTSAPIAVTVTEAGDAQYVCEVSVVDNKFLRAAPLYTPKKYKIYTSVHSMYYNKEGSLVVEVFFFNRSGRKRSEAFNVKGTLRIGGYEKSFSKRTKRLTIRHKKYALYRMTIPNVPYADVLSGVRFDFQAKRLNGTKLPFLADAPADAAARLDVYTNDTF